MAILQRRISAPSWVKGLTVYEVNLRQYTSGGTIREFEEHLPRLKELGVGILWFMPLHPIGIKNRKGTLGSYYSIRDYREINPEFGTLDDFKKLVDKIHKLGMRVIIDWVANHTSWDHAWTIEHPDLYMHNDQGEFMPPYPDWEDVIKLDYDNPGLWEVMINAMEFWLSETGIDGFRCDMAHLVPTHFWNMARFRLDKIKAVYMLAESENLDLLTYAFDTIYNWKLLHLMNDFASGTTSLFDFVSLVQKNLQALPSGSTFLNFTSNHDENSWNGTAGKRLHQFRDLFTVFCFILPGIPLIYSGQEAGEEKRLAFFDKDEIIWKEDALRNLYVKLTSYKKLYIPLNNQDDLLEISVDHNNHTILRVIRKKAGQEMMALFNTSEREMAYSIHPDYQYHDVDSNETLPHGTWNTIFLAPYGYRIFIKD